MTLRHEHNSTQIADHGYVLVIAEQADRFIVVGKDVQITFTANGATPTVVELGKVEEGTFVKNGWVPGRRLNGDEIMLSYDLSALAAENQTGTGLSLVPDHMTILRVDVFRRN